MINKDSAAQLVKYSKLVQQYAKCGDVKIPTTETKVSRQRAGQLLNRFSTYVQRLTEQNASVMLSEKAGDKKSASAVAKAEKATSKAEEKLMELVAKFEGTAAQPATKAGKKETAAKKAIVKKVAAKKTPAKKAAAKKAPVKQAA
jgi:hypothetical protein